jgi:hypothetical protein
LIAGKPSRPAPELGRIHKACEVERDHGAVLAVARAELGPLKGFGEKRVGGDEARHALDQEREARAFRAAEREQDRGLAGVGGRVAVLVERLAFFERGAGALRLPELSHGHDARSHVERDRSRLPGNGEGERRGGDARGACPVVGHVGVGGGKGDRRHAALRRHVGVVAERAGVRGGAYEADARSRLPSSPDRQFHGFLHGNRPRGAVCLQQHARGCFVARPHRRTRIEVSRPDEADVGGHPQHAVRIHPAQVSEDQRFRYRLSVLFGQPFRGEDLRDPALEALGGNDHAGK